MIKSILINEFYRLVIKFLNLKKSDFCVCGNSLTKPNSNSSSICTHGCSGNLTEECGGYGNGNDYYSIYALASESH